MKARSGPCVALLDLAIALAAASSALAAAAGDANGDPLQAPECRSALGALKTQEAAAAGAARASDAAGVHDRAGPGSELQSARQRAARACLASRADPPLPPGRLIQPPIAIAPLAIRRPAPPTAPRALRTLPAPAAPERPYAITSCDPGGCWANDGSRLDRVGTNLWSKRGVCSLHGTLLQCP